MTRVLLVRTSSLGDVVGGLPVATDMARTVEGLELHWMVEDTLAELPRLHPAVSRVIPVRTRAWRRAPFGAETRREFGEFRRAVREAAYDRVIDVQGLMRSAWLASFARGPHCGYDRRSVREPLATLFYDRRYPVSVTIHSVERMRRLAAQALGYEVPAQPHYGLAADLPRPPWLGPEPYLVALHATARPEKLWEEANWVELGRRAAAEGLCVVFPWGAADEEERAVRLAAAIPGARPAPRLGLTEAAAMLAGAAVVVGVDTGLIHLASAVGAPAVALYRATWPEYNGVVGPGFIANLGGPGAPPQVDDVWRQAKLGMAAGRRATGPWSLEPPATAGLGRRRRFRPSNSRAVVHGR